MAKPPPILRKSAWCTEGKSPRTKLTRGEEWTRAKPRPCSKKAERKNAQLWLKGRQGIWALKITTGRRERRRYTSIGSEKVGH